MNKRLMALAAALCTLASAGGAAAGGPQIQDPKGDWAVPSGDIIDVSFSSSPAVRGRQAALRIEMRLAAAPAAGVPQAYNVSFRYPGCESVTLSFYWSGEVPAAAQDSFRDSSLCPDADALTPDPQVSPADGQVAGNVVAWSVPLNGQLRRGAALEELRASTYNAVLLKPGAGGRFYLEAVAADAATGDGSYTIGR